MMDTILRGQASQEVFDTFMRTISEPGTLRSLPMHHELGAPTVAWLALALADVDVAIASNPAAQPGGNPSLSQVVADATGATVTELSEAWIALLDRPTPGELAKLPRGTALEPELGARVSIAVDGLASTPRDGWTQVELSGPGVPGRRSLAIEGIDPDVVMGLGRNSGDFPAGLDAWLVTPTGQITAISRSTHIERESN